VFNGRVAVYFQLCTVRSGAKYGHPQSFRILNPAHFVVIGSWDAYSSFGGQAGSAMTWFISDESHYEVVREIEEQTDRGAAIIGAALLEERLSEAIRSRLRAAPDTTPNGNRKVDVRDQILSPSRTLGDFSVKIDLAYTLGFFGEQCYRDLYYVRKIRNEFAHIQEPITFETQNIRAWCSELWIPKNLFPMGQRVPPSSPRGQYLRVVNVVNSMVWSEIHSSVTKDRLSIPEPYFLPW
jgi:DNA-binding MltR family transcriptional regulator